MLPIAKRVMNNLISVVAQFESSSLRDPCVLGDSSVNIDAKLTNRKGAEHAEFPQRVETGTLRSSLKVFAKASDRLRIVPERNHSKI